MAAQEITAAIDVTLVAATANEVLQVKAATNQRSVLKKLILTGESAAGGTDAVVRGRLTLSTANFGTFMGTVAKAKANPSNGETIQTAFAGDTTGGTRPTTPTDLGVYFSFNPQGGIDVTPLLPKGGQQIPGGQAVNVELTSAGTPTVRGQATVEE